MQNHDRINNNPAERSLQCSGLQHAATRANPLTQFLLLGKARLGTEADGENETIPDWALIV